MLTIQDLTWASSLTLDEVRHAMRYYGVDVSKITSATFLGCGLGGKFVYHLVGGSNTFPEYNIAFTFRKRTNSSNSFVVSPFLTHLERRGNGRYELNANSYKN
jgi:hypothetical protein